MARRFTDLRASGETNMYGALPYLVDEFELGEAEAGAILSEWMRTFSRDKSPAERAAEVSVG